ncbi:IS66 family insertion sequence element accessory protein TnpB [Novosphingobium sp. 11B]
MSRLLLVSGRSARRCFTHGAGSCVTPWKPPSWPRATSPCLCQMAKRLESGGFKWPAIQDGVMRLTAAQLGALLEGLDWRRVHGGRRPIAPQIAG